MSPKPGLKAKLLLLASSLVFLGLLALVGELACRLLDTATLMGTSRELFTPAAWGDSKGNTPDVEAVSFNQPVFTDGYGFRVPASFDAASGGGKPAVLVLGDSVAFGAGVAEERTFPGLLRKSLPDQQIYNSSVIGYALPNYRDVAELFLPEHPEVHTVFLLFCLNDVSRVSARKIDEALGEEPVKRTEKAPRNFVEGVKQFRLVSGANEFLRSRSKLYMTLRNAMTDPQRRYWEIDKKKFLDADVLEWSFQPLLEIAEITERLGPRLIVILAPYEYQLRKGAKGDELDLPQRSMVALLTRAGIEHVDLLPVFRESGRESNHFFLAGDAMHLAEPGHAVVHDLALELLEPSR